MSLDHEKSLPYGIIGFGDREKFYLQVTLEPDPCPMLGGVQSAGQLWGSFQLWAEGRNLCRHTIGGQEYESVSWYLLPLLLWFAENWDCLLHEQRPPLRYEADTAWGCLASLDSPVTLDRPSAAGGWNFEAAETIQKWKQRHCLWTCRTGGLFPDIVFRRDGLDVEISWGDTAPAGAPQFFRFSGGIGAARLSPEEVANPLFEVLKTVTDTLKAAGATLTGVKKLEKLAAAMGDAGRQQRRIALMAGLDSSGNISKVAKKWRKLTTTIQKKFESAEHGLVASLFGLDEPDGICVTGSCDAALMFGSASPRLGESDVFALAEILVKHSAGKKAHDKLKQYADQNTVRSPGSIPWQEGYALAQIWHEESSIEMSSKYIDLEAHLKKWGVAVKEVSLSDQEIGGVAICVADRNPMIVLNTSNPRNGFPTGRRFSLAHELCHLLHDRRAGVSLALISGPWAAPSLEKRANAFAAMMLMPDALVETAFAECGGEPQWPEPAHILEVAKILRVSPDALLHHMSNRGWISPGSRENLLEQFRHQPVC